MSGEKYIGLDVHQATISVAVMDSQGKLIMESAFGVECDNSPLPLEISRNFLKSVEWAASHPSYIQERKGAHNCSQGE